MQRCKYLWMYTVPERVGAHLFTDGIPLVGKTVYKLWTCLLVLLCFLLLTLATTTHAPLESWERCFVLFCLCVHWTLSLLKIIWAECDCYNSNHDTPVLQYSKQSNRTRRVTRTREPTRHSYPIVSINGVPYTVAIKKRQMKTTPWDEDRGTTRLSRNESHYISQLVRDKTHYRNVVPYTVAMKQRYQRLFNRTMSTTFTIVMAPIMAPKS